jgi:hypothetical protein
LTYLLDLLANSENLYRCTSKCGRRVVNQACFAKQCLDDDGYVGADELADLIEPMVNHARNESGTTPLGDAAVGSGKNPLVDEVVVHDCTSRD